MIQYKKPTAEVVQFENDDIITTSGGWCNGWFPFDFVGEIIECYYGKIGGGNGGGGLSGGGNGGGRGYSVWDDNEKWGSDEW